MGKRSATIKDIAKELNITASTVSRALHDHPSISVKTKNLVLQTAKKLNYHPNGFATSLRMGRGNTLGLVVPRINRHFFSNVIHGVETTANQKGYNVLICQSRESIDREKEIFKTLIDNRVEGIIVSISKETIDGAHIQRAIDSGIPVVQFDRTIGAIDTHSVLNDNIAGAYEATAHLIEQGYEKIAHFGGPTVINIYRDRREGYVRALRDRQLEVDETLVFGDIITQLKAYETTLDLFSRSDKPDAIFASSDYAALGALMALNDMKVRIPQDVGIVGFANEPFTSLVPPGLTTLDQQSEEMGRKAVEALFEQLIEDVGQTGARTISMKPQLIIRNSSNRFFYQ